MSPNSAFKSLARLLVLMSVASAFAATSNQVAPAFHADTVLGRIDEPLPLHGLTAPPRVVDASEFGFSPTADAARNVAALQKALDGGKKTVTVTQPGEYRLDARVYIDDETRLLFGPGVVLKKTGRYDFVLVNRGALTRTWNHDIAIDGLTISVNGVDQIPSKEDPLFGLRGHLTLYFARDVKVTHFKCLDVRKSQFCLHFCQFEGLLLDGFEIRGDKDGVHLGAGRNFVVRNGVCATYDDAVALNAQDYPTSQPMQGDITDGVVEYVTDLHKQKTGGNSVRLLAGAWPDWRTGMTLKNGDTVRHGRNVYRVLVKAPAKQLVSTEPPLHSQGLWTDAAGLTFYHSQSDGAVSATVSNVVFRHLDFQEDRYSFKAAWDFTPVNRAVHPDTPKERIPKIVVSIQDVTASGAKPFIQGNASFRLELQRVACAGPLLAIESTKDTVCEMNVSGASFAKTAGTAGEPDVRFEGPGMLNLNLNEVTQGRDIRVLLTKNSRARITGSASLATVYATNPAPASQSVPMLKFDPPK
jgi:hypothetical protein